MRKCFLLLFFVLFILLGIWSCAAVSEENEAELNIDRQITDLPEADDTNRELSLRLRPG